MLPVGSSYCDCGLIRLVVVIYMVREMWEEFVNPLGGLILSGRFKDNIEWSYCVLTLSLVFMELMSLR